jgi:hypothetical protein
MREIGNREKEDYTAKWRQSQYAVILNEGLAK